MDRVHGPTEPSPRAWWQALREAAKQFREGGLGDHAAALTYYSILSLFPFLIVLVSLLGILGSDESIDRLLRITEELGSTSSADTVEPAVEGIVRTSSGAAGTALALGALVGLWTASGYVGAFIRTANRIHGVAETRPLLKLRPLQLAITLALVALIAIVLIVVVLSGPLARALADELGVGETAQEIYSVARWPLLAAVAAASITLLYRYSPNLERRDLRRVLPASALATALWLVASVAFSLYVTKLGSYTNTYGSLAGVIVFLIWLWITNLAVVFGAQFGRELERAGSGSRPPGRPS